MKGGKELKGCTIEDLVDRFNRLDGEAWTQGGEADRILDELFARLDPLGFYDGMKESRADEVFYLNAELFAKHAREDEETPFDGPELEY